MRSLSFALLLMSLSAAWAASDNSPGPVPAPSATPIDAPVDHAYPGVIRLAVDVTDTERRIFRIHETIPVEGGKDFTLLYPEWLPGWHSPEGRNRINRFSGLVMTANGNTVRWVRDSVDVFAFHVVVPGNATALDIEFQYLSPVNKQVGITEVSPEIIMLEWPSVILYPAGYFTRQIPVEASVRLPAGWQFATALQSRTDSKLSFNRVSVETLVDSPLFAGLHVAHLDLDPNAAVPVRLHLFADQAELLALTADQLSAHRSLIQQAYRLFGAKHYDHYDFLVTLSNNIDSGGLEHHRSSQENAYATYLTEWDKTIYFRYLIPHEYVHSWNGKFRRPADLWTPNYNVPMRDSLLWVYEGLTEYWGSVLTARSGLLTRQQALDEVALSTATTSTVRGREWRSVEDTTADEIINPRSHPLSWTAWQRYEDYYYDGYLIWLDADTLIRELSGGQHSLDDLAHGFFGINDGSYTPLTYTFADIVKALNEVQPYDWATFLHARIDAVSSKPPLDGIGRGGYRLVYTDIASDYYKSAEYVAKITNLRFSIGLSVDKDGVVKSVLWDSQAFKSGLAAGSQIVAVNGITFDGEHLKEAIIGAQNTSKEIELIVKNQDHFRVVRIDYHNGLRYPHLERDTTQPARLDDILSAVK